MMAEIKAGRFRQDLYYRLNVVPLKVPNLAERKEDIPALVKFFLKYVNRFEGLPHREFSSEAVAALQAYNWPGNIRQLRNAIEWSLIMNPKAKDSGAIRPDMLPAEVLSDSVNIIHPQQDVDIMSMSLREAREVFEKQYLASQMSRFNNNISKTSSFVGMERSALHRKLKLLNIHSSSKLLNDEKIQELSERIKSNNQEQILKHSHSLTEEEVDA